MKRGVLWSVVSALCGGVGSLVVTPLLVNRLGAVQFGVYVLVLTLTSYASFFDFGLTWAAGRYFAEDLAKQQRQRLAERFHTLARFLIGIGVLSLVLVVLVGPVILRAAGAQVPARVWLLLLLAALSFGLTLQAGLAATLLRVCQRFDEAGRVGAIGSVLLPVGSYIAVRLSPSLTPLLVINAAVNAVVWLLYLKLAHRELESAAVVTRWQPRHLREMAAFGGWATLNRFLMVLVLQVDRLAVALLGSVAGLTYYAVPANLAARINTIGAPFAGLFFSRASVLHAGDSAAELSRQHAVATRFLTWTALALAAPLVLLGPDFLRVWIGEAMAVNGGAVLVALAAGYAVISVASLDAVTLEGSGRPDLTGKTMLVWSALAVTSVLLLAPTLGGLAVAYAVAAWLIGVGVTDIVLCRLLVLRPTSAPSAAVQVVGILLCLAAATAVAAPLRPYIDGLVAGIVALSAVGGTTAAVGLFAILTRDDREWLATNLRRVVPARLAPSRVQP